jgi:N-methylhydantoinase A
MRDAFVAAYRAEFGNELTNIAVVVVNLRTRVIGRRGGLARRTFAEASSATPTPIKRRQVYFNGWHDAAIYARDELLPGVRFEGPAIVEQNDTTTVVEPGMVTRVDDYGNLLVEVKS